MELKPPRSLRLVRPLLFSALALLATLPFGLWIVRALATGDLSLVVMLGPMAALITLALWLRASWMWRSASWHLAADDQGIALKHRSRTTRTTRIAWQCIDTCREEGSPAERDGGSWVTLRDGEDNILLQWERSWFGHSKSSLREFDRFTVFVQHKIAEKKAAST